MNKYMALAIEEAKNGILKNDGGPFGCVIVKNGKVVASAHNQVVLKHDATCHGEIEAIRQASQNLGTFDLSGCQLYTTGEPCNMCLSACIWAKIDKVFYGCKIADNASIGFRDQKLDDIFGGREKLKGFLTCIDREECLKLFEEYKNLKNKTNY